MSLMVQRETRLKVHRMREQRNKDIDHPRSFCSDACEQRACETELASQLRSRYGEVISPSILWNVGGLKMPSGPAPVTALPFLPTWDCENSGVNNELTSTPEPSLKSAMTSSGERYSCGSAGRIISMEPSPADPSTNGEPRAVSPPVVLRVGAGPGSETWRCE